MRLRDCYICLFFILFNMKLPFRKRISLPILKGCFYLKKNPNSFSVGQNNFYILTWSWRFLKSNKLGRLEFKLEKKVLGFRNLQENLRNAMNTNYLPEMIVVKSLHLRFWVENLLISMMTKLDQLLKIMLKFSAVHTLITKI